MFKWWQTTTVTVYPTSLELCDDEVFSEWHKKKKKLTVLLMGCDKNFESILWISMFGEFYNKSLLALHHDLNFHWTTTTTFHWMYSLGINSNDWLLLHQPVVFEGISFKNLRMVHLLPFLFPWNMVGVDKSDKVLRHWKQFLVFPKRKKKW